MHLDKLVWSPINATVNTTTIKILLPLPESDPLLILCASIKGLELLYQPEVVRLYLSLLTCSHNHNTLEAAAGALQNLAAGQWAVSGWNSFVTIVTLHSGCSIVDCVPNKMLSL